MAEIWSDHIFSFFRRFYIPRIR